jgi:hypothetical protein
MSSDAIKESPLELIRRRFVERGISLEQLDQRDYPEEVIFIARVLKRNLRSANLLANDLDSELAINGVRGFITVRPAETDPKHAAGPLDLGVNDGRVRNFVALITANSRTSEAQPSLAYVRESAQTMSAVTSNRHHLIFGRRGAGKTALMLEARRRLVGKKYATSLWINVQTYRRENASRTFAWIGQRLCELVLSTFQSKTTVPEVVTSAAKLRDELENLTSSASQTAPAIIPLVPRLHGIVRRFVDSTASPLFIFLDDFHYLPRAEQPILLDIIHSVVRDTNAWLKVAAIRHLSRWFVAQPPTGLQIGHDADQIDLDLTLENPSNAKLFLEDVLSSFAEHAGISSLLSVLSTSALDRLVLASGGVPRDYLILSARAIQEARKREGSRIVGVQDVNKAAGEAAKAKIEELQDDAASDATVSSAILRGLEILRKFCLEQKTCTYFRIDFKQKEALPSPYGVVQDLMDLRLTHLIERSLSDERAAGRRSEVYMLDLSQYSGQRLRRKLKVLDFSGGILVLKETGTSQSEKPGGTSKQRLGILRRGPLLDLSQMPAE